MSLYYNSKIHQLNDGKILKALTKSLIDFEYGCIIEVKDSLTEIVNSLNEFIENEEKLESR